jgi:hypothetical protein
LCIVLSSPRLTIWETGRDESRAAFNVNNLLQKHQILFLLTMEAAFISFIPAYLSIHWELLDDNN